MKIKVSNATDATLDRLVAKCEGRLLQEPVRGTNDEAKARVVPFTMWEVCYEQTTDHVNTRVWVEPITVTRFGVNHSVGATGVSISYTDASGRKAMSSVDSFYFDKAQAELEVQGAMFGYLDGFNPTKDWAQGGPIIDREKISTVWAHIHWCATNGDVGEVYRSDDGNYFQGCGSTPLVAAMRCFVASRLGDEVEVPNALV